jgi:hypothetical protein
MPTMPTTDPAMIHPDADAARHIARQLRALADTIRWHPELVGDIGSSYPFGRILYPTGPIDVRGKLERWAHAGHDSGAEVSVGYSDRPDEPDGYAHVDVRFGPDVMVHVYGDRRLAEQDGSNT